MKEQKSLNAGNNGDENGSGGDRTEQKDQKMVQEARKLFQAVEMLSQGQENPLFRACIENMRQTLNAPPGSLISNSDSNLSLNLQDERNQNRNLPSEKSGKKVQIEDLDAERKLKNARGTNSNSGIGSRALVVSLENVIIPAPVPIPIPAEKITRQQLVVWHIMGFLDPEDLYRCRRVNSTWLNLATHMLRFLDEDERNDFGSGPGVQLKYSMDLRTYFQAKPSGMFIPIPSGGQSIKNLMRRIHQSPLFPSLSFGLHGYLGGVEMDQFLRCFGHLIHRLDLDIAQFSISQFGETQTRFSTFRTILNKLTPNVHTLKLKNIPRFLEDRAGIVFNGQIRVPVREIRMKKLHRLEILPTCADCPKLLSAILRGAENLKIYNGFHSSYEIQNDIKSFHIFAQFNKAHAIKHMKFYVETSAILQHYESFAIDSTAQLESLCIDSKTLNQNAVRYGINLERVARCLSQIIRGSENSLKEVKIQGSLALLPDGPDHFNIPILSKVNRIEVTLLSANSLTRIFPPLVGFPHVFPSVTSVSLTIPQGPKLSDILSLSLESLPLVKNLEIPGVWQKNVMLTLSRIFPSVENLTIGISPNFARFAKGLWTHFRDLKNLEICISASSPLNAFPSLDSAFTGFTKSACRLFITPEGSEANFVMPNIEALRRGPSILDLRGLRNLKITFVDEILRHGIRRFSLAPQREAYKNLLSANICGVGSFRLMPLMTVTIEVMKTESTTNDIVSKIHRALKPMERFAELKISK